MDLSVATFVDFVYYGCLLHAFVLGVRHVTDPTDAVERYGFYPNFNHRFNTEGENNILAYDLLRLYAGLVGALHLVAVVIGLYFAYHHSYVGKTAWLLGVGLYALAFALVWIVAGGSEAAPATWLRACATGVLLLITFAIAPNTAAGAGSSIGGHDL